MGMACWPDLQGTLPSRSVVVLVVMVVAPAVEFPPTQTGVEAVDVRDFEEGGDD